MRPIRKQLITNEAHEPIAVQISYADWLRIQPLLRAAGEATPASDLSRYHGAIHLSEDPVEYQTRAREEHEERQEMVRVLHMHLTAVYQQVPEGYIAFVEELPGANTQGVTIEEARANLVEAIEMVLEANRALTEEELTGINVIRERIATSV